MTKKELRKILKLKQSENNNAIMIISVVCGIPIKQVKKFIEIGEIVDNLYYILALMVK